MDVLAPEKLVRDMGRAISLRLAGRSGLTKHAEVLARLLGRELSVSVLAARLGTGPKERRETPDVLSRVRWWLIDSEGVSSVTDDADEPTVRLRERIVTVEGIEVSPLTDRGDTFGGVKVGAGSFERA